MDYETAPGLLRSARLASGLTQAQLAQLARTSQSAIAAYEAGDRQPTVPVLARMLAAAGYRIVLDIEPDQSCYRLADLAVDLRGVRPGDTERKLRFVFEFLRAAADDGHPVFRLVVSRPEPTGDERFDALLAAIAEDLSVKANVAPPSWALDEQRFLDHAWWVSDLPSGRAQALVHAPASYRRRGVMLDRRDLQSA